MCPSTQNTDTQNLFSKLVFSEPLLLARLWLSKSDIMIRFRFKIRNIMPKFESQSYYLPAITKTKFSNLK